MNKKIAIAADHAAYKEKESLISWLKENFVVEDLGTYSHESTSYSEYAIKMAHYIQENGGEGILLCGSGIGMSMTANRFKGIRAALCNEISDARLAKEHNNANIICLPARKHELNQLKILIQTWMEAKYEGGRHQKRIDLFNALGEDS